jgi:Inner membrane protein YgaP-like, transmembrane domain
MKKNVGSVDKLIRILAAAVIVILYFTNTISGLAAIILGIAAFVLILTSAVSFCPLYFSCKLSTAKHTK